MGTVSGRGLQCGAPTSWAPPSAGFGSRSRPGPGPVTLAAALTRGSHTRRDEVQPLLRLCSSALALWSSSHSGCSPLDAARAQPHRPLESARESPLKLHSLPSRGACMHRGWSQDDHCGDPHPFSSSIDPDCGRPLCIGCQHSGRCAGGLGVAMPPAFPSRATLPSDAPDEQAALAKGC